MPAWLNTPHSINRSLWQRALLLLHIRTSAVLDDAEDPREVMDYAYSQQLELARRVRRGLVEVSTARRQLEQQLERQRARIPQLEDQARQALDAGREDLAQRALERKHTLLAEMEGVERQVKDLAAEEQQMRQAEQRLGARVDAFRTRRTVVSARYAAASAQAQAKEALFGLSDELTQLDLAVIRAEEKTDFLQARVSAIDVAAEMLVPETPGSFGLAGAADDALEGELRAVTTSRAVQAELEGLKAAREGEGKAEGKADTTEAAEAAGTAGTVGAIGEEATP